MSASDEEDFASAEEGEEIKGKKPGEHSCVIKLYKWVCSLTFLLVILISSVCNFIGMS